MSLYIFTITSDAHLDDLSGYNYFLVDASGGNISIHLQNITADGIYVTLTRIDSSPSNTVTIAGMNGQTINGAASVPLNTNSQFIPVSLNGNWTMPMYEAISTSEPQPIKVGAGTATLTTGSATVSTDLVRADSVIILTTQSVSGILGTLAVGTITAGTSFVINSSSPTDASTVGWLILDTA